MADNKITMHDFRRTVKTHMFEAGDKAYRELLLSTGGLLLGLKVGNAVGISNTPK